MNSMFYGCKSLVSIDLSNYNNQNMPNINSMFFGCNSLLKLNISNVLDNN